MSSRCSRRTAIKQLFFAGSAVRARSAPGSRSTCSFCVLGLLEPHRLIVSGNGISRPRCQMPGRSLTLEPGATLSVDQASTPVYLSGPAGEPVSFVLEIPSVIRRHFMGRLEITSHGDRLFPVVHMSRETAVSSIVGAELPPARAPFAALAAQSVVARSFLTGIPTPRHAGADFCDTTHCQFLRSPAAGESDTHRAVLATRDIVLTDANQVLPALYSASCGGRTESGVREGFSYRSVVCEICRQSRLPRRGHGWGLCQEGAMGLAERGWSYRAILDLYYRASLATLSA